MIPYQAFDRRRPQKTLRGKCLTSSSSLARAHLLLEARRSRAAGKCRREKGLSRHPAWAWAGAEPLQVEVPAFRPRGECDGEVLGECELSVEQEKDVRRRGPRTEAWASSVLVQGGSYSVYDSLKDCVVPYDHRTRPNFPQCLDPVLSWTHALHQQQAARQQQGLPPAELSMGTAPPTTYCL